MPEPASDEPIREGPGEGPGEGPVDPAGSGSERAEHETGIATTLPPSMPERIAGYRVKGLLATGGMGTVYLATQDEPRRTVALKVLKPGISSRALIRRLGNEARILARLRHPNIAQVYEAGRHYAGDSVVPFFAMEYIPGGRTILEYVRDRRLGTNERVAMFVKVCDAVQHGHQRGVIHRDLKPENILVESGEPKIIDFGVARATDSDLAVTTLQTEVGQLIGTVAYMSPEQCRGEPDDLDARSDVYSLGVVLYELVCEQLPYDTARLALHDAVGVICSQPPIRPGELNRTLAGDIETILLKALEKDRAQRYQSSGDLAADLRRFLNHEPIAARPPSLLYRLRKLSQRHRAAFSAVKAVAAVLAIALIIAMTLLIDAGQKARRVRELEEQERLSRQLIETLRGELEALEARLGQLEGREGNADPTPVR